MFSSALLLTLPVLQCCIADLSSMIGVRCTVRLIPQGPGITCVSYKETK